MLPKLSTPTFVTGTPQVAQVKICDFDFEQPAVHNTTIIANRSTVLIWILLPLLFMAFAQRFRIMRRAAGV
jgi:hypothetical protein